MLPSGYKVSDERESRLRFIQFAVDNLSDAVYLIAEDGRIIEANCAACQMLEFTEQELLGRYIYDLNPEVGAIGWGRVWALLKTHRKRTFQTKHCTKTGRAVPVEISANLVEVAGNQYSCAFARDISDRVLMESRLRHAEKMEAIGRLAGGIAHDFNNQLAVILGNAEILQESVAGDPDKEELLSAILQCARHSAELTSQLLAFARQGKYVQTEVDLHEIICATRTAMARRLPNGVVIECELSAKYSMVEGDATQLQNAVLSLAANASDTMPDGGRLVFATENVNLDESFQANHGIQASPGGHIKLRLSDTGHGMDELTQERIFEPFGATQVGKTTGLGLAAAYGTIKHHRGTIVVQSQIGQGTSYEIYLPALPITNERQALPGKTRAAELTGVRVLLVEDEVGVRNVTERMLLRMGCEVTAVEDGSKAIAYFQQAFSAIDVVILDMVMPDMDGYETFKRLKQISGDIRAILASGYSLDGVAHSMMEAGLLGYLQKPYTRESIASKISEVLGPQARLPT